MEKGLVAQVAALVAVIGFLCFAGGYVVAGGITKQAEQYAIGENINVRVVVKEADSVIENKVVNLNSGMTVLDAVAWVIPIKTDLTWVATMGPAVKTADDKWITYKVNGESLLIGMDKCQLSGGENIELTLM